MLPRGLVLAGLLICPASATRADYFSPPPPDLSSYPTRAEVVATYGTTPAVLLGVYTIATLALLCALASPAMAARHRPACVSVAIEGIPSRVCAVPRRG